MSLLSLKLKASTLIETIIAMVILVGVFMTGITVYHKVMSTSMNLQKIKAQHLAQKLIDDALAEKSVFDAETVLEDYKIIKKANVSPWASSLYQLKISVLNANNDTLSTMQKIVNVEE